jgi:hypothetical protein
MLLDAPVLALSAVDEEGTLPPVEPPQLALGNRAVCADQPAGPLVLADPRGFRVVLGAPVPGIRTGSSEARKE